MVKVRVIFSAALIVTAGACGNGPTPVAPPASRPWVVGLVMDSLTPASRLYASPTWAFYIGLVGPNSVHAGLLSRGTLGRDEVGRFARCLGPAVQFNQDDDVFFLALGDTLYSSDSAAYSRNVSQLNHGGAAMLDLLVSLTNGDSQAVLPGLAMLGAPSFQGSASGYGRGVTRETAVLRHWSWRDGAHTFAEDTTQASLVACGLN